jgi:hypothetical protein
VNSVQQISAIESRLRRSTALPDMLAASFDAFETIRLTARHYETRVPELFAAFMTTATAAVEGRDAITAAPSLPLADSHPPQYDEPASVPEAGLEKIADALAGLGALLGSQLARAAARATTIADRAACQDAARSGFEIRQLMARADDNPALR